MAENTQTTTLVYRVDDAAVSNAVSRITALKTQQETFAAALLNGDISATQYAKSVAKINSELKPLENALKATGNEVKQVNREMDKTDDVTASITKELERLERASKIDKIVNDAKNLKAKTKDADAAVKQLTADLKAMNATGSEASGALGDFKRGGGRGIIGEIGLQVRNAPAIPIPGTGITTEPISKAAIALDRFKETMGTTTQGLIAAGIAFAALGAAIAIGQKLAEDNTRFAQARVEALTNVNDLQNASTKTLIDSTREYSSTLANNKQDIQDVQGTLTQFEEKLGVFRAAAEVGNVIGVAGTELGVLRTKITELNNESVNAQANLDTAIQVLQERGYTEQQIAEITRATTEAELELAAARTQGILSDAAAAGQLEAARQQTEGKTKEGLQALVEAENDRIAQLQVELDFIIASGDVTEKATAKMADLQKQIDFAGQKADIFKSAIGGAMTDTEKAAKDTVTKLEDQVKVDKLLGVESSNASKKLAELGMGINETAKTAAKATLGFRLKPRRSEENKKAQDEAQKAIDDYQKDWLELKRDFVMTLNDIGRDLQDAQEDLNIDVSRDIRDAMAEGDFLSIGDITRKARDDRADLEREAARDRRDAQIKANQELLDLNYQFIQAQKAQLQDAIASIRGFSGVNQQQGSFQRVAAITPR